MTRYVNKKHGAVIGSGNVFFFHADMPDGTTVMHDFNAILWFRSATTPPPHYKEFLSPLAQMAFRDHHQVTDGRVEYIPSFDEGFRYFLNNETAGWGYRMPQDIRRPSQISDRTLFFLRRKDALAAYHYLLDLYESASYDR